MQRSRRGCKRFRKSRLEFLAICHVTRYINLTMIKTIAQDWLEEFWDSGKHKRVPPELSERLLRKMDMIEGASELKDLAALPSNHLHPLRGERKGQWAISVNGPWRLCFRFKGGDVFDLELVQYH